MSNMIERNIFVLRDASSVAQPIEYVQGTNAVPILLHVRDYAIPANSTARVYVEWSSTKGEYDESGVAVVGNDIVIEPKDTLFSEVGKSNLQVCIVNGEKTLVTFSYPVMVKKNHVPGIATPSQNHSDFLDEYIANMTAATSSANEAAEKAKRSAEKTNDALDAFKGALEGTVINDKKPSAETTYSSEKIEKLDIQTSTAYELRNSKKGGYRLNDLEGNTVQNGEQSQSTPIAIENTFDCVEMEQGYWDETDGLAKPTSVGSIRCKNFIPCKQDDIVNVGTPTNIKVFFIFYNDKTFVTSRVTSSDKNHSATIPSGANAFTFYLNAAGTTPEEYGKITLTVNGKYVGQIVEHGKNVWTHGDISGRNALRYPLYIPKGTYTVSFVTSLSSDTSSNLQFFDTNGSNIVSPEFINSTSRQSITVTLDRETSLGGFYSAKQISITDIQIEEGTVATPYEPYTEKVTTFFLNEPLRATDRVVKVDGVFMVERNKGVKKVDGTATIFKTFSTNDNDYQYFFYVSDKKQSKLVCDKLINKTYEEIRGNDISNVGIYGNASSYPTVVYFNVGYYLTENTIEAVKKWLASNPFLVEYTLATPIYETLDTESQLALNSLETFDTVTYIEVDSKVKPTSISGEYGTSLVSARVLKEELRNDTDQVEREDMKTQIETLRNMILSLGGNV